LFLSIKAKFVSKILKMLELIRQVNWTAFTLHAFFVGILTFILILVGLETDLSILTTAVAYMGLSVLLQRFIPKHHRMGFKFLSRREYDSAVIAFQESWNYFSKNKWVDDYRAIFLLSASKMSYREMALINRSLSYWQLGNYEKALESYTEVLSYFPESRLAKEAIEYINNPDNKEEAFDETYDSEA
jgi:tetratricopeptide (TPR) repeat protein